jgi:spore germination protein YaaH
MKWILVMFVIVAFISFGIKGWNFVQNYTPSYLQDLEYPDAERRNNGMPKATIQAWIYPGEPGCGASKEIADGREIDILKAEYFTITSDGSLKRLDESIYGCNGYSTDNVSQLKKYSQNQLVTVSGHQEGMAKFLRDSTEENQATNTLVEFVTEHDLLGIEIDFEDFSSWSSEDYELYKSWIKTLGNSLRQNGKKLMVDGPAIANEEQQGWYKWKYEDISQLPVDWIVVMAYDYYTDSGVGNPISPDTWVIDSINWVKRRVSNMETIVVGVPSYGYVGPKGTFAATIKTHEQMKEITGYSGATRDKSSGELVWRDFEYEYFVVDQEALDHKFKLVSDQGIKNVSVWHLGGNSWFSK